MLATPEVRGSPVTGGVTDIERIEQDHPTQIGNRHLLAKPFQTLFFQPGHVDPSLKIDGIGSHQIVHSRLGHCCSPRRYGYDQRSNRVTSATANLVTGPNLPIG